LVELVIRCTRKSPCELEKKKNIQSHSGFCYLIDLICFDSLTFPFN
jgi:hypothetical protein